MAFNMDIVKELAAMGLAPKTWHAVLETIRKRLAAPDWETFSRLHKNFTAYRSETTLSRFYGFVFSHDLHLEITRFRYPRLAGILEDLSHEVAPGLSILDIGAGTGVLAAVLKRKAAPRICMVQDPVAEVRAALSAQGFSVLPHPAPKTPAGAGFDLLICADSLGEINSDEDGLLGKAGGVEAAELAVLLEERFGFAQKLASWKPFLAPGGRILLWEPFAYQSIWEALSASLSASGWQTRLHVPAPGRSYLDIRPM